ncbi:MAG: IS110 family transposase [Myxococcota bacterium]
MTVSHELFVGIDVASRKLDVCFVDIDGNPIRGALHVANNPSGFSEIKQAIEAVSDGRRTLLGCESTGAYHRPLLRAMEPHVDMIELNPLTIRRFTELQLRGSRSDRTDANSIAQYLRTFRPSPSTVPQRERRDVAMAVRLRRNRVEERTAKKNSLRRYLGEWLPGFLTAFPGRTPLWVVALFEAYPCPAELAALTVEQLAEVRTPGGARIGAKKLARMQAFLATTLCDPWSPVLREGVGQLVRDLVRAERDLAELERHIEAATEDLEDCRLLRTVPGIGALTAAVVVAEVGDLRRFETVDHFIGYCGLCPRSKQSGDGTATGKMVRKGNRMLRLQLLLASTTARRSNPQVRAFYQRLRERGKSAKCAGGAAGRKLATQLYAILKTRRDYDPDRL